MKEFIKKYEQVIKYFTFGILTTVASLATYFIILNVGQAVFDLHEKDALLYIIRAIAQVVQWIVGVLVAFFTNRILVFKTSNVKGKGAWKQFAMFLGSRFLTFWIDTALTLFTVWLLHALHYRSFVLVIEFTADVWSKIVAGIVVIIANYVISKYLVFRGPRKRLHERKRS